MECNYDPREDAGFRGRHYFTKDVLPQKILVRRFVLEDSRCIMGREDVTIFYIEEGNGEAVMMERSCRIEPGSLVILYPYYAGTVINRGKGALKGVECVVNVGALLFMFAIPNYRKPVPFLEKYRVIYQLKDEPAETVAALWSEMIEENDSVDCYFEKIQFSLFMKIMALAERNNTLSGPR